MRSSSHTPLHKQMTSLIRSIIPQILLLLSIATFSLGVWAKDITGIVDREAKAPEVQSLGERLSSILTQASDGASASTFGSLAAELPKVQELVASLKEASDGKIKAALNLQLNRNRVFLDELARFIDALQQAQTTDADEQDELDRIARRGYSIDQQEYAAGLNCLSVPVLDDNGQCIAAVAVHAPTARLSMNEALKKIDRLRWAASAISATLQNQGINQ
jgi:hypothetical protein